MECRCLFLRHCVTRWFIKENESSQTDNLGWPICTYMWDAVFRLFAILSQLLYNLMLHWKGQIYPWCFVRIQNISFLNTPNNFANLRIPSSASDKMLFSYPYWFPATSKFLLKLLLSKLPDPCHVKSFSFCFIARIHIISRTRFPKQIWWLNFYTYKQKPSLVVCESMYGWISPH